VLAARGGGAYVPFERIDRAPEESARGITINIAHVHRGLSFVIREGGKTVGAGTITAVPG